MNQDMKTDKTHGPNEHEILSPESLLAWDDLDRDQKMAVLLRWELGLSQERATEEEAMAPPKPLGLTLSEIQEAIQSLDEESEQPEIPTRKN